MKITIEYYGKRITYEQNATPNGIEHATIQDIAEAVSGLLIACGYHPNTVAQHIKVEADA